MASISANLSSFRQSRLSGLNKQNIRSSAVSRANSLEFSPLTEKRPVCYKPVEISSKFLITPAGLNDSFLRHRGSNESYITKAAAADAHEAHDHGDIAKRLLLVTTAVSLFCCM